MNKEAVFLLGVAEGAGLILTAKAVHFAVSAHSGQMRKDGSTEYYEHPIRLARMVHHALRDKVVSEGEKRVGISKYELDVIIASGLNHDTIEDGGKTKSQIEVEFNSDVAHVTDLLSKTKDMTAEEHFRRVSSDIRSILVKGYDRLCNVDDMAEVFSQKKLEEYIKETEQYVLPMLKMARRTYPLYSNNLVVCRDSIKAVLRSAKVALKLMKENEALKKKMGRLRKA